MDKVDVSVEARVRTGHRALFREGKPPTRVWGQGCNTVMYMGFSLI